MSVIRESFSLYIHIPYCVSKCPYCDFNSHVVSVIPEEAYTRALLQELDAYATAEHWRDRRVQSIFFGGGTPSTFRPQSIGKIIDHVAGKFTLQSGCEITLEANPGTVDSAKFAGYRNAGVNRISVGIQSFQPRLLKFLGRVHTAEEGRKALEIVRQAGFDNFSFDLIFANPGQTLGELEADLEVAIDYQSSHLSAYNLTFEEGTPFHHEYRCGRMAALTEDEEIAMAELIEDELRGAGLIRYEISNYALPDRYSRHNVNYWQSGDYLGVGAGAHSYSRVAAGISSGKRWSNEKSPGRYITSVSETSTAVAEQENIDATKAAGEFLFVGLRMTAGISLQTFSHRFGKSPVEFYPKIKTCIEGELMEETNGHLRLTPKGLLLANSIFVEFM
jgi:oxygen-independent coproporphyrinogen-3 oxidase